MIKRIIAWITIILLLGLYLSTLILALLGFSIYSTLLLGCFIGTLVIPIFGFVIIWLYSRYTGKKAPGDPDNSSIIENKANE